MADTQTGGPPPEATTRRPRLSVGPNFGEIVAEVDNAMGRHILWYPTQERLRPRWDWTKLPRGSTSEAGLAKMPAIPGMHIIIVPKERVARILDPLGAKENAKILAEAAAAYKAMFGVQITFVPSAERRGLDDNALATWLYWLWRESEAEHIRAVRGKIPTLDEIAEAMPAAKIRRKFFDSLAYRRQDGETAAQAIQAEHADTWADAEPPAG